MTNNNNKYVLRSTRHSLKDGKDRLLKDQGLIILLEATKYVQINKTERIRYSHLKQLCNDKLAYLTSGRETDFGGKFENNIVKFESKTEPAKRFLDRDKIRRKESYIIPDVEKIEKLFAKYDLSDFYSSYLLDEELVSYRIKGPIPMCPKEKDVVIQGGMMLGPFGNPNEAGHIEPSYADDPPKLYSVCYFYENGNPVFVNGFEDHFEDQCEKDPMPFYEDKSRYRSISFIEFISQTYPV